MKTGKIKTSRRFIRAISGIMAIMLIIAVIILPCAEAEGTDYVVICSDLNLRTGASTGFSVITQLPLGSKLTALYNSGDWTRVDVSGQQGWVYSSYIKKHSDSYSENKTGLARYTVLDISQYQGDIDWDELAKEGLYGVILRLGLYSVSLGRNRVDDKVEEYYKEAKKRGLNVGMYYYSVATSEQRAADEAAFVMEAIENHSWKLDLPFYYDAEAPLMQNKGGANIRLYAETFCGALEKAGYRVGIYASTSWIYDYYEGYPLLNNRSLWVADYRGYCGYSGDHDMWQYSDKAKVDGIPYGYADINVLYRDLANVSKGEESGSVAGGKEELTSETLSLVSEFLSEPVSDHEAPSQPDLEIVSALLKQNEIASETASGGEEKTLSDVTDILQGYIFGDADMDGRITAGDARQALRVSARLEYPLEISLILSDVDCNGRVTADDARIILRAVARLTKMPRYTPERLSESEAA